MKLRVSLAITLSLLCSVMSVHAAQQVTTMKQLPATTAELHREMAQLDRESWGLTIRRIPIVLKWLSWRATGGYKWAPDYDNELNVEYCALNSRQSEIEKKREELLQKCVKQDPRGVHGGIFRCFRCCCGAREKREIR